MDDNGRAGVTVDVVSDVMCPWCYIGKKNLESAREMIGTGRIEVRWHPFQLDASLPAQGKDRRQYLAEKFGGAERAEKMYARVEAAGRAAGILFAFDRIGVAPNTLDAHRVIRWAGGRGQEVQDHVVTRLFQLYFEEGADIGNIDVLADAGASAGMDRDLLLELLSGDADRKEVEAQIANASAMGINGVPCFIIDRRYAVMGAQPPQVLADAIQQAAAEKGAPSS